MKEIAFSNYSSVYYKGNER